GCDSWIDPWARVSASPVAVELPVPLLELELAEHASNAAPGAEHGWCVFEPWHAGELHPDVATVVARVFAIAERVALNPGLARHLTRAAASATRSLSARASVGLRGRHAPYRRPRPVVRISGTGRLVPSVCNPSVGNRSRAARARVWALPQPSRYQAQAKRGSSKNRLERSPQATRTAFRLARARATYART